ncbi:MAG: hypothetical protein CK429_27845 [Mycobacterium sp.]|nr:MAG: hypothetical protein CK429_27845 [Mycobacterium sp.]
MGAALPHRFALHRRRRGSLAPLSPASGRCPHLIASLCIVAAAGHAASNLSALLVHDLTSS